MDFVASLRKDASQITSVVTDGVKLDLLCEASLDFFLRTQLSSPMVGGYRKLRLEEKDSSLPCSVEEEHMK